jgi:hypothetical protein
LTVWARRAPIAWDAAFDYSIPNVKLGTTTVGADGHWTFSHTFADAGYYYMWVTIPKDGTTEAARSVGTTGETNVTQ